MHSGTSRICASQDPVSVCPFLGSDLMISWDMKEGICFIHCLQGTIEAVKAEPLNW